MVKSIAQRLKETVSTLARPEGRVVGTRGHKRARKYLTRQLQECGFVPYCGESYALKYRRNGQDFYNLVGVVPGRKPRKKPVLIGAHYDSVIRAPCADDNAAAVAIALQVGRMLLAERPERDTLIVLFDAEEPPHFHAETMGSTFLFNGQLDRRGVHAALIMDLVGHDVQIPVAMLPGFKRVRALQPVGIPIPRLRNTLFVTGAESHPQMAKVVRSAGCPGRLHPLFALNHHVGDMSDHGVFRRNGIPYLFLSCGRWQHYHQPTDTPDRLNYTKMARIAQYVEALVRAMGKSSLKAGLSTEVDTAELEIESLKRALGPALPVALKALGVGSLRNREDLDALAEALLRLGL